MADCILVGCANNHLLLHVVKTKEMLVDFQLTGTKLDTIFNLGEAVDVVKGYRLFTLATNWSRSVTLRVSTGKDRADSTSVA